MSESESVPDGAWGIMKALCHNLDAGQSCGTRQCREAVDKHCAAGLGLGAGSRQCNSGDQGDSRSSNKGCRDMHRTEPDGTGTGPHHSDPWPLCVHERRCSSYSSHGPLASINRKQQPPVICLHVTGCCMSPHQPGPESESFRDQGLGGYFLCAMSLSLSMVSGNSW